MTEQDNNEIRLDEIDNTTNKLDISHEDNNNVLVSINNDNKNEESAAPPEIVSMTSNDNAISSSSLMTSTLNETILTTLKRDLHEILIKIKYVINPLSSIKEQEKHIIQWDLWGPLLFTIILSLTTSFQSNTNQFVIVFSLFWIGGAIIYANSKMLGTKLSLFSYWCLLGYGLVPYVIASIPLALFSFGMLIRFGAVFLFALWAFWVCYKFLQSKIEQKRTFLIMYPIGLFYAFFIGLLVIN